MNDTDGAYSIGINIGHLKGSFIEGVYLVGRRNTTNPSVTAWSRRVGSKFR